MDSFIPNATPAAYSLAFFTPNIISQIVAMFSISSLMTMVKKPSHMHTNIYTHTATQQSHSNSMSPDIGSVPCQTARHASHDAPARSAQGSLGKTHYPHWYAWQGRCPGCASHKHLNHTDSGSWCGCGVRHDLFKVISHKPTHPMYLLHSRERWVKIRNLLH